MTSKGDGFQVHVPTVSAAGQAAHRIADAIAQLSTRVDRNNAAVPSGSAGLAVGISLHAVAPLWVRHLSDLGGDVLHTGTTLGVIAANYTKNEIGITRSFNVIH